MTADELDLRIAAAAPRECVESLSLLFSHLDAKDRTKHLEALLVGAGLHGASLDGLLTARRAGRLAGAAFALVHPGRSAMVWPPRLAPGESEATADALLAGLDHFQFHAGVRLGQALIELGARTDRARLERAGYEAMAQLIFLVSPEIELPARAPRGPLVFEPYSPENHHRLARVVEATYAETLDCPRLNGVADIEDVLAGYRATGQFHPEHWLLVQHAGRDVGCLLLADHPEQGNVELVYMGLIPSARGQGWGFDIARQAQWLTRQAGRRQLILAVDSQNEPALDMYTSVGFRAWDQRDAYIKVFPGARNLRSD